MDLKVKYTSQLWDFWSGLNSKFIINIMVNNIIIIKNTTFKLLSNMTNENIVKTMNIVLRNVQTRKGKFFFFLNK